jgi:hypothetical protein
MSLREKVAQQKLAAEERITSVLASAAGRDADGSLEDEASQLESWEGKGAYMRTEWGDGPPPPGWQLADWVSALRVDDMVASAIAGQVLAMRASRPQGDGAAADTGDITFQEVAQMRDTDVKQIAQASANALAHALRQRVSELHEAAMTAAAASEPGSHGAQILKSPIRSDVL